MRDAFISYNHQDRAWAEKLYQSLTSLGYDVFLDQKGLRAGGPWHSALDNELAQSHSLVVLWSKPGIASDWVQNEVAQFKQRKDPGPVVQIALNATYAPLAELQTITSLHSANQYAGGAANVDPNMWTSVIEQVEVGVGRDNVLPVHKVIVASTKAGMKAILSKKGGNAAARGLTESLTLGANIHERYGSEPGEWRPFGQTRTIDTLLADLRQRVIEGKGRRFKWRKSTVLWSAVQQTREAYMRTLSEEPCAVIIDALSLYDTKIRDTASKVVDECLSNPVAAIMLLPPRIDTYREPLRGALEEVVSGIFMKIYREFRESRLPRAQCSLLTPDDLEIARLLANVVRSSDKDKMLRMA